jgi:hypothetical protein
MTSIEERESPKIPSEITIKSIFPNPFNSSTTISITGIDKADIGIYDITGRLITKLGAENGKSVWNATSFSSGVYFARIMGTRQSQSVKLVLLR